LKIKGIDTILFDLDGTLIDCKLRQYSLFKELTGCRLSYEEYWNVKNTGFDQQAMLDYVQYKDLSAEKFLVKWKKNIERLDLLLLDKVFDDVSSVLENFKQNKLKLFVVTNRQSYAGLEKQLSELNMIFFFTKLISTLQQCTKEEIIAKTKIQYKNAIFVGDNKEDMDAGKFLKIPRILIDREGNKFNVEADFYINSLQELREMII